jgi:thioredoxin-related protein
LKGGKRAVKQLYNITIIISFIIFSLSCSGQNSSDYQLVEKFDPQRNASGDLALAIEEAERSNRNILLDVGGEWCIWCHKLDKFFDENPDIKEYLHKNFVVLKINYSPENKNEEFLAKYPKIPGYPHFFVLDKNGNFLHSQGTGELEEGDHHDRKKIFEFLKFWANKQ